MSCEKSSAREKIPFNQLAFVPNEELTSLLLDYPDLFFGSESTKIITMLDNGIKNGKPTCHAHILDIKPLPEGLYLLTYTDKEPFNYNLHIRHSVIFDKEKGLYASPNQQVGYELEYISAVEVLYSEIVSLLQDIILSIKNSTDVSEKIKKLNQLFEKTQPIWDEKNKKYFTPIDINYNEKHRFTSMLIALKTNFSDTYLNGLVGDSQKICSNLRFDIEEKTEDGIRSLFMGGQRESAVFLQKWKKDFNLRHTS